MSSKKTELIRSIKYLLIAASAGIIQIGTFTLLNELLSLEYYISYGIALVLSVIWNFTFNRKYTFKSANNVPVAMLKVLAYYIVFTPASMYLEKVLTDAGLNAYLVTAINMLINVSTELPYQRFFVFGKNIDTNKIAIEEQANEIKIRIKLKTKIKAVEEKTDNKKAPKESTKLKTKMNIKIKTPN